MANQPPPMCLPRVLSPLETWGFGFTGLLLWLLTAPVLHAALGPQALFIWLPVTVVGTLFVLQVKRLGTHVPEMAGGTPDYTARLLRNHPWLARYTALAYLQGWTSVPPLTAVLLADLIAASLEPLGVAVRVLAIRIAFVAVAFVVVFGSTSALSALAVRPRPDGHADARARRLRRHAHHPTLRARARAGGHADHRADRRCPDRPHPGGAGRQRGQRPPSQRLPSPVGSGTGNAERLVPIDGPASIHLLGRTSRTRRPTSAEVN